MEAIQDGVMPCSPEAMESTYEEVLLLEHGRVELHSRSLDIGEAVRAVAEALRPLMQSRGLEVRLTIPAEPVVVIADASAMGKVLRNLLTNAAIYTDAEGCVTISLDRGASEARVVVRDTGIGIAPTDLSYVFERFYCADDRHRPRHSEEACRGRRRPNVGGE